MDTSLSPVEGKAISWTCPFCNHSAIIRDGDRWSCQGDFAHPLASDRVKLFRLEAIFCPNANCGEYTLELSLDGLRPLAEGLESRAIMSPGGHRRVERVNQSWGRIKSWMLRPDSKARPFPDYIPKAILEDYREACLIAGQSPKASATLARRCMQGMIRDFWGIKENNLKREVDALQGKVDEPTWKAIDAVRRIGNIGAHMEADMNFIVEVDPEEATLLIGLIESLLTEWYIAKHDREERMEMVRAAADSKK